MPSSGTLISKKYQLATQSTYVGRYDYRFTYNEAVTLYKWSSSGGVPTWTSLSGQTLPKLATTLEGTLVAAAIAAILF
jgi:tetrahydromethanopterin S-methyltransferase subunit E